MTFVLLLTEKVNTHRLHGNSESGMYFISNVCVFKSSCKTILDNDDTHFPTADYMIIIQQISSAYDSSIILIDSDYPGSL